MTPTVSSSLPPDPCPSSEMPPPSPPSWPDTPPTWATVLKRTPSPHLFRPTPARPFLPVLPAHPLALPVAPTPARTGSFRRWKLNAGSLAREADALLAEMPGLDEARPAAVAAAAAFRALQPFLAPAEHDVLRRAFSSCTPLQCLSMVVRVAQEASTRTGNVWRNGAAWEAGVWGDGWPVYDPSTDANAASFRVDDAL